MHWLDARGAIDLLPLKRLANGNYEISPFHAGQDPTLGNLFQYAYYRPEPPRAAKVMKTVPSWKPGAETLSLEVEASRTRSQILIFRSSTIDPKRPYLMLGIAKDDATEEGLLRLADQDPKPKKLRFKIKTSELNSNEPFELFALELNYPPDGIPEGSERLATRWKVTPPAAGP
jgi:hypothetical protein